MELQHSQKFKQDRLRSVCQVADDHASTCEMDPVWGYSLIPLQCQN